MSQISVVPILPQLRHSRAVAATRCIRSASGISCRSRLAMRCSTARRAERGPSPGSLAIISIRASISRFDDITRADARPSGGNRGASPSRSPGYLRPQDSPTKTRSEGQLHVLGKAHAFGEFAHFFLGAVAGLLLRVLDGGKDQILDHFLVIGIEDRRIDIERLEFALGAACRLYEAGAGDAFDHHAVHVFLQIGHLLLHFLSGLHHLGHVAHLAQSLEHHLLLGGGAGAARQIWVSGVVTSYRSTEGDWQAVPRNSVFFEGIPFILYFGQRP